MAWVAAAVLALVLATAVAAQAAPFVYVTNSLSENVSQYDVGAGGLLTPLSPATVAAGTATRDGVAVSPDGQSVYVTNFAANFAGGQVSQYDVGPGGALSPKSPPTVAAGGSPRKLAVSPDGNSVYVADFAASGRVFQYDVGPGGALSPKSPPTVAAGGFAYGVAVSPDGNSVYVTNFNLGNSSVSQYDVGPGGALSPKSPPTVAAGNGPIGVAVSPDGKSVYVANFQNALQNAPGSVSQYDVGPGGALSPKSPPTVFAGSFPREVALSPDGHSVYVTNTVSTGSVLQYDVGPGGALSPKSPPTVAAGGNPDGVGVSPDGQSVYVANVASDNVSQYDVGAGGALAPLLPATVAAGDFPEGVAVSPLPRVPTTTEECKNGGWRNFGTAFKNQGQCVAFVQRHPQP